MNRLFEEAGLRTAMIPAQPAAHGQPAVPVVLATGCSTHSIRRSAAQWGGRCQATVQDVRCAGRWKTVGELLKYMGQGALQREQYENDDEVEGQDPIFRMFVFKPVTEAQRGQDDM